ncbi:MAG: hypothetical protein OXQ84_21915 [bacterium]|nr:hypothetical protein [bacterium]
MAGFDEADPLHRRQESDMESAAGLPDIGTPPEVRSSCRVSIKGPPAP